MAMTPTTPAPAITSDSIALPGLDVVGHGLYLRPNTPYELRRVLFPRTASRLVTVRDATTPYTVPEGYDLDDSPPLPAGQLLNQVKIEESWDRFNTQLSLDTTVAAGNGAFSISASASNASQMRAEQEAYYAVRSSFIPLWSVYLSDTSNYLPEIDEASIPTPFKFSHRREYEAFFERYGSHYVKRAWLGGKAMLFFTVLKSSHLSKQEIQAGIKASYTAVEGEAHSHLTESREKLLNSSQCSVSGKGGDELKLAALSSLDEANYNQWVSTVRENPQTIELEVAGLWTLLKDPAKAEALSEAYRALNVFTGLTAATDTGTARIARIVIDGSPPPAATCVPAASARVATPKDAARARRVAPRVGASMPADPTQRAALPSCKPSNLVPHRTTDGPEARVKTPRGRRASLQVGQTAWSGLLRPACGAATAQGEPRGDQCHDESRDGQTQCRVCRCRAGGGGAAGGRRGGLGGDRTPGRARGRAGAFGDGGRQLQGGRGVLGLAAVGVFRVDPADHGAIGVGLERLELHGVGLGQGAGGDDELVELARLDGGGR